MLKRWYAGKELIGLAALVILCCGAPLSYAQTEPNGPNEPNESIFWPGQDLTDTSNLTNTQLLLRMLGGMVVVIALMLAVLYLSKRVLPQLGKNAGKEIKIIETTMLGPRKYLHVIKVANQRLLLGSTNDRINMLAHLVDDLAGLDIEHYDMKEGP